MLRANFLPSQHSKMPASLTRTNRPVPSGSLLNTGQTGSKRQVEMHLDTAPYFSILTLRRSVFRLRLEQRADHDLSLNLNRAILRFMVWVGKNFNSRGILPHVWIPSFTPIQSPKLRMQPLIVKAKESVSITDYSTRLCFGQ